MPANGRDYTRPPGASNPPTQSTTPRFNRDFGRSPSARPSPVTPPPFRDTVRFASDSRRDDPRAKQVARKPRVKPSYNSGRG